MPPADFRALLAAAGLSRRWLAEAHGVSRATVDTWCDGASGTRRALPPPAELVVWLTRRAADTPPRRAGRA
jgi:DNA-binding transcriptional regulator YiaG